MQSIIEHQQEVVNNCLIKFDDAIDRKNVSEAQEALKKWLKESKRLDILEDLNLQGERK